jgi:hypothetical protein
MRCQSRTTKLVDGENLHDTKIDDASDVGRHFKSDQNFCNARCVIYEDKRTSLLGVYGMIDEMLYQCIIHIHSSVGDKTNEI